MESENDTGNDTEPPPVQCALSSRALVMVENIFIYYTSMHNVTDKLCTTQYMHVLIHEPIYQYQHLNSDILRFQACSSVFLKFEVPGLFLRRYLALLPLLKCMRMRRYKRTCRLHPSLQAVA